MPSLIGFWQGECEPGRTAFAGHGERRRMQVEIVPIERNDFSPAEREGLRASGRRRHSVRGSVSPTTMPK